LREEERVALIIDFDGTAATTNVGMSLIEAFAKDDSWRVIDDDYERGKVGSKRAFELLAEVLGGTPEEWAGFIETGHTLDPDLSTLVECATSKGWSVEILSDGLDFYIHRMLERENISLPVRAATLSHNGVRAIIEMSYSDVDCGRCSTCKKSRVEELLAGGYRTIFIGDGLSDRCGAPSADRIFAKDKLAEHLREHGIGFEHFETLSDVTQALFGAEDKGD